MTLIGSAAHAPDLVIMGSHDVALDVVVGALAERGFSARTLAVGSLGGVAAASRGECDIAPVHLIDPASGEYNVHLAAPGLRLVRGWQRMQGILFRPGDKRFEGRSAHDGLKGALADSAALMVNRNAGSGTKLYGLGFLPLSPEHYDFLLVESRMERPAVRAFLAALREPAMRARIAALGMKPSDE